MNFKKVLAGACAGAMVFGMCAMPAFAADAVFPEAIGSSDEWGTFINPAAFVDDLSTVDKIVLDFTVGDTSSFGGIVNVSADSNSWG